jgi:hypothetical protein
MGFLMAKQECGQAAPQLPAAHGGNKNNKYLAGG